MKSRIVVKNPPKEKPVFIYDGECGFCKRWADRWKRYTRGQLEFLPSQEAKERFVEIPQEHFQHSVQFIQTDGHVFSGAEAVFRSLAYPRQNSIMLCLYFYLPFFSTLCEAAYRLVARNRYTFSKLMTLFLGKDDVPPSYRISRHVFIRGIALVYLFAFLSVYMQWEGLIGSNGIAPAAHIIEAATSQLGENAFWRLPSLFYINVSDAAIYGVCLSGIVSSVLIYAGICPALFLVIVWVCYLSICNVDQTFFSFQWDNLLLETGLLAVLYSTIRLLPSLRYETNPPRFVRWMIYWLLFRLMYGSGFVKLASQDETWRDLTALNFHYFTQPIPTWAGWYAHHLPDWFLSSSVVVMFFIEIILPFMILIRGKVRLTAFWGMVWLQVLILITGNYGFFNFLTIVLCLSLIEDRQWQSIIPFRYIHYPESYKDSMTQGKWRSVFIVPVCTVYFVLSSYIFFQQLNYVHIPERIGSVLEVVQPFRSINRYGLFANMTTTRPEIMIEGSMDGESWEPYIFHWKPVRLHEPPVFIGTHMPRLDWQMWFAALGRYEQNRWLIQFMAKLLQDQNEVTALLRENPFDDAPPKYIRAVLYEYNFTSPAEKVETGNWWKREQRGLYCPVLTLPED